MKFKNFSVGICIRSLLTSYTIIKPKDHYEELALGWKDIVVPLHSFDQAKRSEITKINGMQLREELKKHPKAVVGFVVNHGSANSDLKIVEDAATANGYRKFIIMCDFRMPYEIFN